MNRFRVSIAGIVLFLVVTIICVLMTSHKSAAQNPNAGPDVHIVSPLPLPVTGTLGLASGSAVTVNNPASSPVLVRDVDRGTPFQMFDTAANASFVTFGPVPSGQRWIIEHVSCSASALNLTVFSFFIQSKLPIEFFVPQKTGPDDSFTNSQTKFIADPGDTVSLGWNGEFSTGGTPSVGALISGVIVPAP